MKRLDLYILHALLSRFLFFVLVLAGLYWINTSILTFKRWLVQGHEISLILKYIGLTLPETILATAPYAALIACLVVFVRFNSDHESTILHALGWSPLRISRAVFVYGILIAALLFFLSGFGVPWSKTHYETIRKDVRQNFSIGLLRPERFIEPVKNVTFFIGKIDSDGQAKEWFVADQRTPNMTQIFSAKEAVLIENNEGPQVIFENGSTQVVSHDTEKLANITFSKTAFNLNALIAERQGRGRSVENMSFLELWRANKNHAAQANPPPATFSAEINARLADLFLPLVFGLLALGCLSLGDFNRSGLGFQIIGALIFSIILQIAMNMAKGLSFAAAPAVIWAPYSVIFIGIFSAIGLLLKAGQKHRIRHIFKKALP